MLDADVMDSMIGEGCVTKNCKIHHSTTMRHVTVSDQFISFHFTNGYFIKSGIVTEWHYARSSQSAM
ncbi:hypothetical protein AALP_AA8G236900 [Arabis alpina]|uniref:Uncharacterized protein n=1 Tax=Arabis alpina TaxID=50452 RepID=A0A087G8Z9_ARAAL|nr:hypothetical protein AALP_AA8G236900 [Arabis alpina]